MIVLSLVLVIVAAVALIAGFFQPDDLTLIWVSIGACVTAMLFLGIGVLQRKRSTPATSGGYGPGRPDAPVRPGGSAAPSRAAVREQASPASRDQEPAGQPAPAPTTPAPAPATPMPTATPAAPATSAEGQDEETVIVRKASARRGAVKKVVAKKAVTAEVPADEAAGAASASEAPARSSARKAGTKKAATKKAGTKKATRKAAKKPARKAAGTRTTGAAARAVLGGVRGVGPAKQDALLKKFGSIEDLRAASADEIATVRGIGPALAAAIKDEVG